METAKANTRVRTDIDTEMLAVRRIRRELENLTTARSRTRAIRYVLDALIEEEALDAADTMPPGPPPRQLTIEDAVKEPDIFGVASV